MQRVLAFAGAVSALGASSLGCGSAAPVDFFNPVAASSMAGASAGSAGAAPSSAGAATAGSAGASLGAGGGAGNGAAGSTSDPNAPPCSPVKEASNMASGDFQSTGPLCLRVTDPVVGWGCSNWEGRSVKVNGVAVTCGDVPLPERVQGAYYFDISAGDFSYASFYWWSA